MSVVLALLSVLSGFFSKGSMSFESELLALIVLAISAISTSREHVEKEKCVKRCRRRFLVKIALKYIVKSHVEIPHP
jgi:hypothetical protein